MIPIHVSDDIEIEKYEDVEIIILKQLWENEKRITQKIELLDNEN